MLSDAAPVAFIPSTDLAHSRRFYEETLGQAVVGEDNFAVVLDVGGTTVRVVKVGEEFHVQPFTVFGWRVADLDAEIAALGERGVEFLRFEGMEQDELGAWRSPTGTRIAWFRDPDGNTLSLND
ncbi:MAG: VOC family protein [Actinobacteria bacterium]|nr:VOC family protein [Actinomycetota bacterium]